MNKSPDGFLWWKHGIIYHIYPLSYFDSNNDGYGDLKGITAKLDYIVSLGVSAIWLSPVFKTGFKDYGYDVIDYYNIDPVFGDMSDFIELLNQVHLKGLKLVLDMVLNHTSINHPWFIESSSSIDNPKRDWYIWRKRNVVIKPNNWRSVYGGSAWEYVSSTDSFYLHTFFKDQADLNWRHPEVLEEFISVIKYWLDLGVDGFRLDVINMLSKDSAFKRDPGFLESIIFKKAWKSRNQPEVLQIIARLRQIVDLYKDRVLIGEIYTLPPGDSSLSAQYLHSLHLAFDFSIIFRSWNAKQFFKCIDKWQNETAAPLWPCQVFSNHDIGRSTSRFCWRKNFSYKVKLLAVFQLSMRGTPFIYYGEEIGMRNIFIPRSQIKDQLGKRFWPFYKGRDGSRTPMQWNNSFSRGFSNQEPWLPCNSNCNTDNVASQEIDGDSILNFYKSLIKLRNNKKALSAGDYIPILRGRGNIIAFERKSSTEIILVVINFSRKSKNVKLKGYGKCKVLLTTNRYTYQHVDSSCFELSPYEAKVLLPIAK